VLSSLFWVFYAPPLRRWSAGGVVSAVAGRGPVLDVLHMTGIDELVTVVAVDHMR
jgi:hypothetical protein